MAIIRQLVVNLVALGIYVHGAIRVGCCGLLLDFVVAVIDFDFLGTVFPIGASHSCFAVIFIVILLDLRACCGGPAFGIPCCVFDRVVAVDSRPVIIIATGPVTSVIAFCCGRGRIKQGKQDKSQNNGFIFHVGPFVKTDVLPTILFSLHSAFR